MYFFEGNHFWRLFSFITSDIYNIITDLEVVRNAGVRIDYPEHNLVRARCQIALAKDMLEHMGEMEDVIERCVERYSRI